MGSESAECWVLTIDMVNPIIKTSNHSKLLDGNRLRIGSTVYKFAKSREIDGAIKTVTIKRDTLGDLYVFFSCVVVPPSLADFVQILHHVADKTGTRVHHIDPWFPSTKLCSVCGQLNARITL